MKFGYTFVWVKDVENTAWFYETFGLKGRLLTDNGEFGLYAEMKTGETTLAIAEDK